MLLGLDLLLRDGDGAHQRLGGVDVGSQVLLYETMSGGLVKGRVFRDVEILASIMWSERERERGSTGAGGDTGSETETEPESGRAAGPGVLSAL